MMSALHATATTPTVVPPCALRFAEPVALRGGVGVTSGVASNPRWTRGGSADPILACFTQDAAKPDHGSRIENGGGLRTRVEGDPDV